MKSSWLLSGLAGMVGVLLLSSPAEAGRLQSWQLNRSTDSPTLRFTTDDDVQPRVQLLANPSRLVIDLPETRLDRPAVTQSEIGAIQSLRIAQFDGQTTRIVIQFAPGYTIDPQQVRVRGASPTQWTVEMPQPVQIANASGEQGEQENQGNFRAASQLEELRVTPDGFFLRTGGETPQIRQRWEDDRRRLILQLPNTALSQSFSQRQIEIDRYGVEQIQVDQAAGDSPNVTVTLLLSQDDTDWRISPGSGGVALIPTHSITAAQRPDSSRSLTRSAPDQPATIQGIDFADSGRQLVIRADRSLTNLESGWNRTTAEYQIVIPNARLADNTAQPRLEQNSPVLRFRAEQRDPTTVVIQFLPAAGIVIGELRSVQQTVALSLQGRRIPAGSTPSSPRTPAPLPNVSDSRITITIDPGHGGRDPGAVGIGGIRETDIVLDISLQVAELLQRQGVEVLMTRTDEREIDLQPRVSLANRARADLFVSIHANSISLSRPDVNGAETYYYSDSGRVLAQAIQNSIIEATGMRSRGVKSARFYVLRNTQMPAALVEVGFVTGAEDARLLADRNFRSTMAQAIVRGILQYVQQSF
ncbi:N-acetylmuramoyl-L-alanine amidase [Leptolyngbya sp. FACHB-711]|uniref:N-acetylmuramoyl-L-alanine amidase n=1 Tax=unclassified Leptolyngbya TaxID=2650499 RepID=UPI0018F03EB7